MRPELDKEIDSLLRSHARRGGGVAREGDAAGTKADGRGAAAHLDADELVAFAENALPAAARTRYTAHLADCDDCRKHVAEIALAAGTADRLEERVGAAAALRPVPALSWRERLAALFAPRAWRYAMPVVALLAVSTVVLLVATRMPRESSKLARRGGSAERQGVPVAPESHHANTSPEQLAQANTQSYDSYERAANVPPASYNANSVAADDPAEVAKLRAKTEAEADRAAAGAAAGVVQPAAPKSAAPAPQPTSIPSFAPEPAATPAPVPPPPAVAGQPATILREELPPPATPTPPPFAERAQVEAKEKNQNDARNRAASNKDEARFSKRHGPQRNATENAPSPARGEDIAAAKRDDQRREEAEQKKKSRSGLAASAPQVQSGAGRRTRQAAPAATSRAQSAGDKAVDDREAAETRSVGGRRFRRQGSVWVDTAFKSSQATVVVRRDSEQYRALVADEPEIGRISRALGGEVVIVWKGRAYRIKP